MPIDLDYEKAAADLARLFEIAEADFAAKNIPNTAAAIAAAADVLFTSNTQAYREVLLGCALARLQNQKINIRTPYAKQGDDAFNGRTLDEDVVNPFLHEKEIPASKGPYLAVFRRNVKFLPDLEGLKDKAGYAALMQHLDALEDCKTDACIEALIRLLLFKFVELRDKAHVTVAKIERLSLSQYSALVEQLLQTKSGGLLPVLLTVAMFRTIKACYSLPWEVEWQGINVADKASGAGGDITIKRDGAVFLAVEVTERVVDGARVVSTFNTKIVRNAIPDYLFLTTQEPAQDATEAAGRYFAQGHEMNFLAVHSWLVNVLGTIGATCRKMFTDEFLTMLQAEAPAAVKVRWNELIKGLFG